MTPHHMSHTASHIGTADPGWDSIIAASVKATCSLM